MIVSGALGVDLPTGSLRFEVKTSASISLPTVVPFHHDYTFPWLELYNKYWVKEGGGDF